MDSFCWPELATATVNYMIHQKLRTLRVRMCLNGLQFTRGPFCDSTGMDQHTLRLLGGLIMFMSQTKNKKKGKSKAPVKIYNGLETQLAF